MIAVGIFLLVAVILTGYSQVVLANPASWMRSQSASATTSPAYMTPGTATTSVVLDTGSGNRFAGDSAALLVQLTASSTDTLLTWIYEYSQDPKCSSDETAADWYGGGIGSERNQTGTTTPFGLASSAQEYRLQFASSSPAAGATAADNNRSLKLVEVPLPARCVRVSFYLPTGSTNGAVWAEWVGKKETQ